jgi:hypothetical protein
LGGNLGDEPSRLFGIRTEPPQRIVSASADEAIITDFRLLENRPSRERFP